MRSTGSISLATIFTAQLNIWMRLVGRIQLLVHTIGIERRGLFLDDISMLKVDKLISSKLRRPSLSGGSTTSLQMPGIITRMEPTWSSADKIHEDAMCILYTNRGLCDGNSYDSESWLFHTRIWEWSQNLLVT
jgi:hypothetical protein